MRYSIGARWWMLALVVVVAASGMIGCLEPVAEPTEETQVVSMEGVSGPSANVVVGEVAHGAKYALYCPENWNGDLVLYAHGFIDADGPLVMPTNDNWPLIRDHLLDEGYAVAYSSFCSNGFAVDDGVRQTHQVRGLFVAKYGVPGKTYLMGHSLGGAIVIALAETHPAQYDGVLSMSGMIGGSQAQIDYVADVRILFDYCYPGVVPGTVVDIPEGLDLYQDVVLPVAGAIQASPDCAFAITQIDQTPVPFSSPQELVESFATAIGFNIRGFEDVRSRTQNHMPVDNAETVYTGPLPQAFLDALNAGVQRYDRPPDADNYLQHHFEPTGDLHIPVMTMHNLLDPSAPMFHEDIYEALVTGAGNSDMLVRRTVTSPAYGHCKFGDGEAGATAVVSAFLDLVNWVESGVRPSS